MVATMLVDGHQHIWTKPLLERLAEREALSRSFARRLRSAEWLTASSGSRRVESTSRS
jgi:predicted TIM-barrel fold metal-dependent hydrolase